RTSPRRNAAPMSRFPESPGPANSTATTSAGGRSRAGRNSRRSAPWARALVLLAIRSESSRPWRDPTKSVGRSASLRRIQGARMSSHSQFALLKQRRFLPFFATQAFGAFNDNVYRQAIIGLLFFLGVSTEERTLYTNLAPALFILPYFLFSAT